MVKVNSVLGVIANGIVRDFSNIPKISAFNSSSPVSLVNSKKDTKTLSHAAGYALAGFEQFSSATPDWHKGLFVSAPHPAPSDKAGYSKILQNAGDNKLSVLAECLDQVQPVSGLIGLPNGVMCFAARTTGAFGPNSVAVNEAVGCHQSIASALRHFRAGTIESAIVAGFAHPLLPANRAVYHALGLQPESSGECTRDLIGLTDSVVLVELSVGDGVLVIEDAFLYQKYEDVLQNLLKIGIDPEEIAIIFLPQIYLFKELTILNWVNQFFPKAYTLQSANGWGYQAEASGLVELGILQHLSEGNKISDRYFVQGTTDHLALNKSTPFIILSESIYGQRSCVIGRIRK